MTAPSITRDSNNETLFENEFEVEDNKFEVELIQTDNVIAGGGATTTTGNNTAIWFGPDVDVDYTGEHTTSQGTFSLNLGNYTLGVEMTRIGSNPPPQPLRDDFSMSVVSGATTATNATNAAMTGAGNATTTAGNATTTACNATTTAGNATTTAGNATTTAW